MFVLKNFDRFLERKFIGENKNEKVEKSEKNKNEEASAIDKAHRVLNMPEKIDKLQENLKKIFQEISLSIKDIETKNKNYEYEIEDFHKRIAVLEKEAEVLKHKEGGNKLWRKLYRR